MGDDEPVPARETVASAPAAATISFAISPWGEVHINGRMHGISPPLRNVELGPGRYRVEIRNAGFPPHVEVVDVRSGGKIRIRHKFQN
jgi:serine/threonine-protein kinase